MFKSARFALFTACALALACGSADEPAAQKKLEVQRSSPVEAHAPDKTLLGATAREAPRSVVDRAPTMESPKAESPKPDEPKLEGEAAPPELTEESKAIDYDRPLEVSEVKVDRFVLATDVKDREPVDVTDTFTTDTKKIFAFVQLANGSAPYAFRVHFEKLDESPKPYGVKLTVPTAPRFRTWAWTAIEREPGMYKAVLRTLDGKDIDSREFVIEPAETCLH